MSLLSSAYDDLGVRVYEGGGTLRVFSANAERITVTFYDEHDQDWPIETLDLTRTENSVWQIDSPNLTAGTSYALHAHGPAELPHAFNSQRALIDPYARGLKHSFSEGQWRSVVVDDAFDWGSAQKPNTPWANTVIYEAHVKGLTKRHPKVPTALHGTYAGAAHEAMIEHYKALGITALEFLPVHAFTTEPWILQHQRSNYWGYNTLGFFAPHALYATKAARREGPAAVLREFKGMVKLLHEAGIEVILDVVYNHTSEGSPDGPTTSLRGLDNASYYRHAEDGQYIDTTGCGNSVNTSTDAAARLVLDSVRYWATECQVDGFRFDLASELARDGQHNFTPEHPLLQALKDDPQLQGVKLIAEPWDVGAGGWQTGNFPSGWHEWNDRYRDRVRNFWLSDIDYARRASTSPAGIGGFATRLSGSSNTFTADRGPLASINFVTAHDGFTLHDLVSYNVKHNENNGEHNRDGTDNNRSFNHGIEGETTDPIILAVRRKAMRNLLGTLLLSAGVPMLIAGDEIGRSQNGNNNPYNHDSVLTWLPWTVDEWQEHLRGHVQTLIRLRSENAALRPDRFAVLGEHTPGASQLDWFDPTGEPISVELWQDPAHRTLQYLAAEQVPVADGTPTRDPNRVLLIVHGIESPEQITLPHAEGVARYVSLWSSADEVAHTHTATFAPGDVVTIAGTSMHLLRAEG